MNQLPPNQTHESAARPEAFVVSNSQCPVESLELLCQQLMESARDPASTAIAAEFTTSYHELTQSQRARFMSCLKSKFGVVPEAIHQAAEKYKNDPCFRNQQDLAKVVEAPRQKLFRCINTAPEGLKTLVQMRQDLLEFDLPIRLALRAVEEDLKHLLQSWFNRGFLKLKRIDWDSPASLLEKLIEYEAVHQISHWGDLRRRLQGDRRCYAFFHPSLAEEPLVFVQVALTNQISGKISALIEPSSAPLDSKNADTAMFYSISSCQPGLRGISFGGLLIKQVVNELQADLPGITTFSTLSPVPGFCRWLGQQDLSHLPRHGELKSLLNQSVESNSDQAQSQQTTVSDDLEDSGIDEKSETSAPEQLGSVDPQSLEPFRSELMGLLAYYLLAAKLKGRPIDSVARFHLGNGAQLREVHWMANSSNNGLSKSFGMMVNYVYEIDQIRSNRKHFLQDKIIAAHPSIHALAGSIKT